MVEVEVDAERAGCVAERQVRLGLVGEEATPETSALKDPCERTPIANERARVSSLHASRTDPSPMSHAGREDHSLTSVALRGGASAQK